MMNKLFKALFRDKLAMILTMCAIIMIVLLAISSRTKSKNVDEPEANGALLDVESVVKAEDPTVLSYGESVQVGELTITIDGVYYADAVRPENRHGTFAYLKDMPWQQYLVLTGTIKNDGVTAWPKKLFCGDFWLDNDPDHAYRTVFLVETSEDGFVEELPACSEQRFSLVTTVDNGMLESLKSCTVQLGLLAKGEESPADFAACDLVIQVDASMSGSGNIIAKLEETDAAEASEKTKWDGMD